MLVIMHQTERTISQTHIHPEISLKRKKSIFDLCDTLSVQVRLLKLCMLITSFKLTFHTDFCDLGMFSSPLGVQSDSVSLCGWWSVYHCVDGGQWIIVWVVVRVSLCGWWSVYHCVGGGQCIIVWVVVVG